MVKGVFVLYQCQQIRHLVGSHETELLARGLTSQKHFREENKVLYSYTCFSCLK